jgi:hypothetical protein
VALPGGEASIISADNTHNPAVHLALELPEQSLESEVALLEPFQDLHFRLYTLLLVSGRIGYILRAIAHRAEAR